LLAAAILAPWSSPAGTALADDPGKRLEGVVLDIGGSPASGAAVTLKGRDIRREAPADAGGRFFLEAPPGAYLISAADGSIASAEIGVEIRDGEATPLVTLQLRPPQPVEQAALAY
ncbi:MAG TPA: carboxypeptidase-like regulatory domain-containing protein, partial [Candidatus Polarisedimenticolia bacterium]|nr:carboxypeptidase-like regulatory domain-containing protein [Candidatus Polarisedimenticolia bacterium]